MTAEHPDIEQRLRDAFAASEAVTRHWPENVAPMRRTVARRRKWIAPLITAAAVAAIATPLALLGHGGSDHYSGAAQQAGAATDTPPAPVSSMVVIDPSVSETFTPAASSSVVSQLSSDAAFQRYAKLNGSTRTTPAQGVTVQLGYLTLPVGGGLPPTADHELVWAYSWKDQCPAQPDNLNVTSNSLQPCTSWLFLDAASGKQVDWTWQR